MTKYYSSLCVYHIFSIQSSVDGPLGYWGFNLKWDWTGLYRKWDIFCHWKWQENFSISKSDSKSHRTSPGFHYGQGQGERGGGIKRRSQQSDLNGQQGSPTYSMGWITDTIHTHSQAVEWGKHCFEKLRLEIIVQTSIFGDYVTLDRPFYLSDPQFPYLKLGGFICLTKVLGHNEVANVKGLCCTCVRDY